MASSFYSKTYSYVSTNTVRFTESQAKNDTIFKNINAYSLFSMCLFKEAFPRGEILDFHLTTEARRTLGIVFFSLP
jgi:hypothetical protein